MKRKSVSRGESPGSGKQADVGSVAPVAAAAAMPPVCTADVPDEAEPQPKRTSPELQKASDNGDDSDSDSTRRFHANSLRILITDTRDPSFIKSYFLRHPAYEASWMDNWFRREQWETHDRVLRHWKSLCMDGQQLYVPDVRDPIINEHVLLRDETPGVTSTNVWAFIEKQIKDEVEVKAEQHMDYQIHLMLVRAPCPRCLVSVFAAGSVRAKALRVGGDCVCVCSARANSKTPASARFASTSPTFATPSVSAITTWGSAAATTPRTRPSTSCTRWRGWTRGRRRYMSTVWPSRSSRAACFCATASCSRRM